MKRHYMDCNVLAPCSGNRQPLIFLQEMAA